MHTLWCDDIRQELGNKPSFMGVYVGGLVLPALPTVMAKLCVWITVSSPVQEPVHKLSVRIVRDDGLVLIEAPEAALAGDNALPSAGHTRLTMMLGFAIGPIELPANCKYFQVRATADGIELEGSKLWVQANPGLLMQAGMPMRPSPPALSPAKPPKKRASL